RIGAEVRNLPVGHARAHIVAIAGAITGPWMRAIITGPGFLPPGGLPPDRLVELQALVPAARDWERPHPRRIQSARVLPNPRHPSRARVIIRAPAESVAVPRWMVTVDSWSPMPMHLESRTVDLPWRGRLELAFGLADPRDPPAVRRTFVFRATLDCPWIGRW